VRAIDRKSPAQDIDPASLVREFLPLNRRRLHGQPALTVAELERWEQLRDLLEDSQGAVPPAPGERRRRSIRVRTHLKVLVTTHLAQELLLVHDVSENGVFLRTQRPSSIGTPLQVEFHDLRGRSLELEATVVWVRTEGEGHGPAGMGVAFHALSDWDRTVLLELVEAALEAL
jgi:uncharacterized protein (TIGR02266 family)